MIPPFTTSGNSQPWKDAPGYKDRSDPHARLEPTRYPYDKVELAICAFMVIVTGVVLAIAGGLVVL